MMTVMTCIRTIRFICYVETPPNQFIGGSIVQKINQSNSL